MSDQGSARPNEPVTEIMKHVRYAAAVQASIQKAKDDASAEHWLGEYDKALAAVEGAVRELERQRDSARREVEGAAAIVERTAGERDEARRLAEELLDDLTLAEKAISEVTGLPLPRPQTVPWETP